MAVEPISKLMAIGEVVDMQHHPWGNQYFPTSACGGGPYDANVRHCFDQRCGKENAPADCYTAPVSKVIVQHGPQEALFNRVQACAKDLTVLKGEAWYKRYWPFVKCVEDGYSQGTAIFDKCSSSGFSSEEVKYLHVCLTTSAGDASVVREAKATPDHEGTPTVLVNGKLSSPENALKDACAAYKGTPPPGCSGLVGDSSVATRNQTASCA